MPHLPSRRHFLKTTGCLTIGFALLSTGDLWAEAPRPGELPGSLRRNPRIDAWLQVLPDGRVRVLTGKIEIGQGIRTAVAQVAAEELNLPLDAVDVVLAETGRTPDERYTAGSASIEQSAMAVRYAAAAARQRLLALAAARLRQPAGRLQLERGAVVGPNGTRASFTELLAGRQLTDEVHAIPPLKPKSQYQHVGRPVPRADIEHMVRAEAYYVQDLRFPGMLHARVLRPPTYEARLDRLDAAALQRAVPGLLRVVQEGSFVGLLAEREFDAKQAQDRAPAYARWSGGRPLPAGQPLPEVLRALPATTRQVADKGRFAADAAPTLRARYFKPYLMHGSIGPSCAVALFEAAPPALHVWTHSQGVYPLRDSLAKLLGLPAESVYVKGVPGSGCYGHNGADDVAADAALLARAVPGRHVRLQWSRDDEHAWEPYGSAMAFDLEARLDPNTGRITHWQHTLWSDTHSTRPGGAPEKLLPARYLDPPRLPRPEDDVSGGIYRNAEPYYDIPNLRVTAHAVQGPLRVSALRSLGAFGNVFALESFLDELAVHSRQDPYELRLRHLRDERAKAVIRKVREMVRHEAVGEGEGLGLAFARYKNEAAYCAVVAKVQVARPGGYLRVLRLWAAIDAGEVINPDGLRNQTEGGLTQAASWTINEEVLFNAARVTTRQWEQYPIYRFDEVPLVEVAVLDRPSESPLGAGEAAQGPTAAALANAVFRASGRRVRELPIRPEKLAG